MIASLRHADGSEGTVLTWNSAQIRISQGFDTGSNEMKSPEDKPRIWGEMFRYEAGTICKEYGVPIEVF